MKKGLIFTVMLVSVLALGYSQTVSWNVNNVATWVEAVGAIRSGGNNKEYVITVNGNISVPSSTENTFGSVTGITITIQGSGTLSPSANGSLLYIGARQTIVVKDLTLRGRDANNAVAVKIENSGTFRMEGRATVTGNTSSGDRGGGVYVAKDGVFTIRDNATVSNNTTNGGYNGSSHGGGGVYVEGTFIMEGGTITGNIAANGGGVCVYGGTFAIQGGTITGNSARGGNDAGCGGGVCVFRGNFAMHDGTISNNTAAYGVGVYNLGTFTMEGGTITGNIATGGRGYATTGGGVENGRIFTMQNGAITSNSADNGGGVENSGTFTMQNGTITGNSANNGGGVYIYPEANYTIQGGTISNNTATNSGGGVYNYGSFTMQNNASVSGNTAGVYGGGVYISMPGTAQKPATLTKLGGTIYGDDAEQNLKNTVSSRLGHALYNEKNDAWRNATAGQTMSPESYGFWLNDGDVTIFPSSFAILGLRTTWKRSNFNNTLSLTRNTIKSSSSNFLWVLQRISGNAYTFKRSDAANTLTLTMQTNGYQLLISGDSGSGQDNWNGTWVKQ